MGKTWRVLRVLIGVILFFVVLAFILPSLTSGIADERIRSGVLIQALPFFAAFVAVLLTYITLIFLMAVRFNGKVPNRTYGAIETILIVGILGGVVLLFQPFHFVGYRYGFLLVLISLLGFILWSHVLGRSAKRDISLPSFTAPQQIAGAVAFVIVAALTIALITGANAPREPYGVRERVWNTYDDARKAEIAAEAQNEFNSVEIPFVVVLSFFPAALFFVVVRELAASIGQPRREESAQTPIASRSTA